MVVRLAKLMNLHSASVVILIAIPSTFFPDSTPTALAEGLFYMVRVVDCEFFRVKEVKRVAMNS